MLVSQRSDMSPERDLVREGSQSDSEDDGQSEISIRTVRTMASQK